MLKNQVFPTIVGSIIIVLVMIAIPTLPVANAGPTREVVVEINYKCETHGGTLCSSYFKTVIEKEESFWHRLFHPKEDHACTTGSETRNKTEKVDTCSQCSF